MWIAWCFHGHWHSVAVRPLATRMLSLRRGHSPSIWRCNVKRLILALIALSLILTPLLAFAQFERKGPPPPPAGGGVVQPGPKKGPVRRGGGVTAKKKLDEEKLEEYIKEQADQMAAEQEKTLRVIYDIYFRGTTIVLIGLNILAIVLILVWHKRRLSNISGALIRANQTGDTAASRTNELLKAQEKEAA